MATNFELTAKTLVDQHYAAGPDALKQAVAKALEDSAIPTRSSSEDPRERFERELADLQKASELGSE